MSKINAREPMWSGARCQGCGSQTDVKFFEFAAAPHDGAPRNIQIYCQGCAGEVGVYLQRSWGMEAHSDPDLMYSISSSRPAWLVMMDKLGKAGEDDQEGM